MYYSKALFFVALYTPSKNYSKIDILGGRQCIFDTFFCHALCQDQNIAETTHNICLLYGNDAIAKTRSGLPNFKAVSDT